MKTEVKMNEEIRDLFEDRKQFYNACKILNREKNYESIRKYWSGCVSSIDTLLRIIEIQQYTCKIDDFIFLADIELKLYGRTGNPWYRGAYVTILTLMNMIFKTKIRSDI